MSEVPKLLGRATEIARIDELIDRLPAAGSSLLLTGEPGVGTSALLAHAVCAAQAEGMRVITVNGVEAESGLRWAGLHHLLLPLKERIGELACPQREALLSAFGAADDERDQFLVSLAAFTLLSECAGSGGLLVAVDDVHLLDTATQAVLAFIARRVSTEPIVLLMTAHPETDQGEPAGLGDLDQLTVAPLGESDARALLGRGALRLDSRVEERILSRSLGNPLALLELRRAAEGGNLPRGPEIPLTRRLMKTFARQVSPLEPAQRTVLLLTALGEQHPQRLLDAAAALLGAPVEADTIDSLLRAGLLVDGEQALEFRHPLVRSAVLHLASRADQRRARRAVASLLPRDADRRTWHLAVVAERPDAEIAAALDAAAGSAHSTGDFESATAAYARASELSPDPHDANRRRYAAAEAALHDGRVDRSRRLATEVIEATSDPVLAARAHWLLELLPGGAAERGSPDRVLAIAETLAAEGAPDRALHILHVSAFHLWNTCPDGPVWQRMIAAAEKYAEHPADPRLLWLRAFSGFPEHGAEAIARLALLDEAAVDDPEELRILAMAVQMAGDTRRALPLLEAAILATRRAGQLRELAVILQPLAGTLLSRGRLREAHNLAEESERWADEVGEPFHALANALVTALVTTAQGESVDLGELASTHGAVADALPHAPFSILSSLIAGLAAANSGDHRAAFRELGAVADPASERYHWGWAMQLAFPHYLDAAARVGDAGAIGRVTDVLARHASTGRSELAAAWLLVARAARPLAQAGAALPETPPEFGEIPFAYWRGRLELLWGERMRRQRRIVPSRDLLRSARDVFRAADARAWAERARRELLAAGEDSPRPQPQPGAALTPQEERIARLAATELSNHDIAERLYLSPRTVGAHLQAVYRKLEIHSRTDLAGLL